MILVYICPFEGNVYSAPFRHQEVKENVCHRKWRRQNCRVQADRKKTFKLVCVLPPRIKKLEGNRANGMKGSWVREKENCRGRGEHILCTQYVHIDWQTLCSRQTMWFKPETQHILLQGCIHFRHLSHTHTCSNIPFALRENTLRILILKMFSQDIMSQQSNPFSHHSLPFEKEAQ